MSIKIIIPFLFLAVWVIARLLTRNNSVGKLKFRDGRFYILKGRVKPYGSDVSRSWEWDGRYLWRQGAGLNNAWKWNGKHLEHLIGDSSMLSHIEWIWDGKTLEHNGSTLGITLVLDEGHIEKHSGILNIKWEWDGKYLTRDDGIFHDAWEWDGQYVRHCGGNNEVWEIEGDIPVPVVAKAIHII